MSSLISGRAARRSAIRSARLKGAGYTRAWRKGRTKRYPPKPEEHEEESHGSDRA
jgi:hypothetical protein